ncbi:AAA family ATPase [Photobacterium sp. GJ3]|uniref:DEAD/DEAH box helicase n=1 Tax=Photobacterium sp. GJ3 TaxID=2829502 RepID=UPI001B8AE427|nr:ATP-binding protein [Photobacterium sp. GJ3]QUJ68818.1 AAA family ATPase [Photobacterium sp. GJ3]
MSAAPIHSYLSYFRRCYREDSQDLSLSNIAKLRADRRVVIEEEELLFSGMLPMLPVSHPDAESLSIQADLSRREKRLIYGTFLVKGKISVSHGFSTERQICSPIIFMPAEFQKDESGHLCIQAKTDDIRLNRDILRQILKPDIDPQTIDTFPMPDYPVRDIDISQMGHWLRVHTQISALEHLANWPQLESAKAVMKMPRTGKVELSCGSLLFLAERSRGVRGTLHELNELISETAFSQPFNALFPRQVAPDFTPASKKNVNQTFHCSLPYQLSLPQQAALNNAANYPLSLISGPPGTGKSFTIAAMAIDRMMQGESVLIVAKTEQAIDVIAEKLRDSFGLDNGYVHATSLSFNKTMRQYLEQLLHSGINVTASHGNFPQAQQRKLESAAKQLRHAERTFSKALWISRFASGENSGVWFKKLQARVHSLWNDHHKLWDKQKHLHETTQLYHQVAMTEINRVRATQIERVLQKNRAQLHQFWDALKARHSKTQEERFANTDFSIINQAFPIWLVTTEELSQSLPRQESMFDLVIFDEASQSDIASALPAIYRAKRAVVAGDVKQLRHISFLSRAQQSQFWQLENLPPSELEKYAYRDRSLLDLVSACITDQTAVTFLDEHFRSQPDLIHFSNQYFYQNRLKVMKARPAASQQAALSFQYIPDGQRSRTGKNDQEKAAVLSLIETHILASTAEALPLSIGVISPYREQAMYLESAIESFFPHEVIQRHAIRVSTPFGFQGEERDLMILSMAIDAQSNRAAAYLNREDMFNVMITRARQAQIVVHSVLATDLSPQNLFRRYLQENHQETAEPASATVILCDFAQQMKASLEHAGIQYWVHSAVAGENIDIICQHQGNTLGLDLIGYEGEFESYFDIHTHRTFQRAGLSVLPVPYKLWKKEPERVITEILERLNISDAVT